MKFYALHRYAILCYNIYKHCAPIKPMNTY